jgi:hypothetical protein
MARRTHALPCCPSTRRWTSLRGMSREEGRHPHLTGGTTKFGQPSTRSCPCTAPLWCNRAYRRSLGRQLGGPGSSYRSAPFSAKVYGTSPLLHEPTKVSNPPSWVGPDTCGERQVWGTQRQYPGALRLGAPGP